MRVPERVRPILEGLPDRLAALELQEELGVLRPRHNPHLHQAHISLQSGKLAVQQRISIVM